MHRRLRGKPAPLAGRQHLPVQAHLQNVPARHKALAHAGGRHQHRPVIRVQAGRDVAVVGSDEKAVVNPPPDLDDLAAEVGFGLDYHGNLLRIEN